MSLSGYSTGPCSTSWAMPTTPRTSTSCAVYRYRRSRLVPAEFASYNEVTPGGDAPVAIVEPELPAFATRPGSAMRAPTRSSTTSRARATRGRSGSPTLRPPTCPRGRPPLPELYKPLGIEYQIAFAPSPPTLMIGIALSRGGVRDFSDDERTMLDLARPHLIQAYRNAQLRQRLGGAVDALQAGLEKRGIAALVVDPEGVLGAGHRPSAAAGARADGRIGSRGPSARARGGGAPPRGLDRTRADPRGRHARRNPGVADRLSVRRHGARAARIARASRRARPPCSPGSRAGRPPPRSRRTSA